MLALVLVVACGGGPSPDDPTPDAGPDARPDAAIEAGGVRRIDLGPVTDGVPVSLAIPERTLGFQLVIQVDASTGAEAVGIERLASPTGEVVIEDYAVAGHGVPIAGSPYGIGSVSIPLSSAASAMPVRAGTWTATFDFPAGKTARAHVLVRSTADGAFHGGKLDLRIYLPDGLSIADPGPAHVVTTTSAATDPAVTARLDSLFATLKTTFDLDRGAVEFLPLPSTFTTIDSDGERLDALSRTTPFADGFGLHLVWTQQVTIGGTTVWGNAAWIPGLPNTPQRWLSGVVIDVASGFPAAADGMTMVHELGHFLGLFHTTEANLTTHDPLADTAECTAMPCPDGRNIMFATFWGASGGVGITATAQQRNVVWGSPWYRAN